MKCRTRRDSERERSESPPAASPRLAGPDRRHVTVPGDPPRNSRAVRHHGAPAKPAEGRARRAGLDYETARAWALADDGSKSAKRRAGYRLMEEWISGRARFVGDGFVTLGAGVARADVVAAAAAIDVRGLRPRQPRPRTRPPRARRPRPGRHEAAAAPCHEGRGPASGVALTGARPGPIGAATRAQALDDSPALGASGLTVRGFVVSGLLDDGD